MLIQLTIKNYVLVRELQIEFGSGMTVLTGETGSGKSIVVEALGVCLGERAEASMVRANSGRADLSACFQISAIPEACEWLASHQLETDEGCIIRRTINADGRTRSFINGTPVTLAQLRALSQHLVHIHGQHAHQQLLNASYQRQLLDQFADHHPLVTAMRTTYQCWLAAQQQLQQQQQQAEECAAHAELLHYQLQELNDFAAQPDEYQQIVAQYQQLASCDERLALSQQVLQSVTDNDQINLSSLLSQAMQQVRKLVQLDETQQGIASMLEEAAIRINESVNELRHYHDHLELDPQRLHELEQRIAKSVQLARKHQIAPEALPARHQQLQQAWETLEQQTLDQARLKQQLEAAYSAAVVAARALHASRQQAATVLAQRLTATLPILAMPHGRFAITLTQNAQRQLSPQGSATIDFLVTTNPDQPLQPLSKVASGGELSRIALALQVMTAGKMDTPSLIFDEIDNGISGQSALMVGQLLRQLGSSTQVLCITHLPQVAGCGHHHLLVSKQRQGLETTVGLQTLELDARLQELARLLAGAVITPQALANARELLVVG